MAGLALLTAMMVKEVSHLRRGATTRSTPALAMLLVLAVVAFSFAFFMLDRVAPHQMVGLQTRTDALYFTLSTMTTVGFGDVHATGQVARLLVIALIVFDVAVAASFVRALTRSSPRGPAGH